MSGGKPMGETTALVAHMREVRANLLERLAGVTEEQMVIPAQWGQRQVNVRFIFYRFIAHEVEHTVHLMKTLAALGRAPEEAQLILGRLEAARGELEGLLVGLSDEDLNREPAPGEWSVRQVLEHIVEVERDYLGRVVDGALAGHDSTPAS